MSFHLPDDADPLDPRPIIARLVEEFPEFALLRDGKPVIWPIFRDDLVMRGGKQTLGMLAMPQFQGVLARLAAWLLAEMAGPVDFIMVLDRKWWEEATDREREALIFHELAHAGQAKDRDGEPRFNDDGLPVWCILEHDVTAFHSEVRRYGAWHADLQTFLAAARENRT